MNDFIATPLGQRPAFQAELLDHVLEPVLALAIPCPGQTGPDASALLDSGIDPTSVHVRQRPTFADVLQDQQILADRAEVRQLEQRPVMRPVLEHLLVAAGGARGQPLAVDDLGLAATGKGVIGEVLEHLWLPVDAGDDHVVAIHGGGR